MSTSVRTIRIDDETWSRLQNDAAAAGVSRNALIASLIAVPSLSAALDVVSVLQDHGGIEQILALADDPKLAAWDRAGLRDLGQQLVALAKRWPR